MVAGQNVKLRFWRIAYDPDDVVGGAVITGSVTGEYPARLRENPPSQLLLQQGLETVSTYTAIVVPGTIDVRDRDEADIVEPADHPYYHQRMRVMGQPVYGMLNPRDPRNYIMITLSRSRQAHAQQ